MYASPVAARRRAGLRAREKGGRARYLSRIRLRHVLDAITSLHFGAQSSEFEGDDREGIYWNASGSGDHHVIAWDPSGLVAMAFDHERVDSEATIGFQSRRPERLFVNAPASLSTLVRSVIQWKPGERLGTAAEWIAVLPDGSEAHGHDVAGESDQLKAYRESAKRALEGPCPDLSEAHARLAITLARDSSVGPRTITWPDARERAADRETRSR